MPRGCLIRLQNQKRILKYLTGHEAWTRLRTRRVFAASHSFSTNHKSTITWIIYSTLRWDLIGNGTVSNIVDVRIAIRVRFDQSAPRWRFASLTRSLSVKFLSDKRSSLAILVLSGVKSASNCIKPCQRWIAMGLGDYSELRCCCLDAFRTGAQKRAGLSYLLQETRALLPPLDLLIS